MAIAPIEQDTPAVGAPGATSLTIAGLASIGAGAIHAAAVGVHSEHHQAVWLFVLVAAFQITWGVVAMLRPGRVVAVVGLVGNAALLVGWLVAKTSGLWFIDGMEQAEAIQPADALAAGLAAGAVLGALASLVERLVEQPARRAQPAVRPLAAIAVAAIAIPGMIAAGSHTHAGHGDTATAAAGSGHTHDVASPDTTVGSDSIAGAPTTPTTAHVHEAAVVPPKEYDPKLPIDLSGIPGVTPEEQARAENLVAVTLTYLPQFADPAAAEKAGYHSIGDGLTGYEHYINWSYIDDGYTLDPNHAESLVYRIEGGTKKLVSAMYMLRRGTTLDSVPDVGGALTQWHIHDDLCFTNDPVAPQVAGVTSSNGPCNPPLVRLESVPMIHVWIVPHPCGPFAALEGVGAGQIKPGETRLCDTAHGSTTF